MPVHISINAYIYEEKKTQQQQKDVNHDFVCRVLRCQNEHFVIYNFKKSFLLRFHRVGKR